MMPDYEQYMKQLTQWLLSRETVNFASWEAEGNTEIRDSSVVIQREIRSDLLLAGNSINLSVTAVVGQQSRVTVRCYP